MRHELIGLQVMVAGSTDPGLAGLSGKVIDETRNMFIIETKHGERRVPKSNTSLTFTLPDGQRAKVAGSVLISQPENRINKKMKSSRWKL